MRIRDLGYTPGLLPPGPTNSILDIPSLSISQLTLPTYPTPSSAFFPSSSPSPTTPTAHKGLTILLPRPLASITTPCHAGHHILNGNGCVTGLSQIADWGYTNTCLIFTNSLSLGACYQAAWDWQLSQFEKRGASAMDRARDYGTPVVGETADWTVNADVGASRLGERDVRGAFEGLRTREEGGIVREGQEGGGAGMTCHQFAGGTGTASRVVGMGGEREGGGKEFTLGVLVQANYGHLRDLVVGGVPVGRMLQRGRDGEMAGLRAEGQGVVEREEERGGKAMEGSILVLIVTNAPLLPHQLSKLARHATVGLAQVGSYGVGRTHSGDIFLALSTAEHGSEHLDTKLRHLNPTETYSVEVVKNESIDAYYYAVAEATEEAILNCLVASREGVVATDGTKIDGFPVEKVKSLLDRYLVK